MSKNDPQIKDCQVCNGLGTVSYGNRCIDCGGSGIEDNDSHLTNKEK